jgi:hypothetical protein
MSRAACFFVRRNVPGLSRSVTDGVVELTGIMRKTLEFGALFLILILVAGVFYNRDHVRRAAITDLSRPRLAEVSVGFAPNEVQWKMSGHIEGAGSVIIPFLFSNMLSGDFSAQGRGPYTRSNAWLVVVPEGEAHGRVEAVFSFATAE